MAVLPSWAMFTVERLAGDGLATWALTDTAAGTRAEVIPARGGMVTRFVSRSREVLFMDPATLRDPTKNVRGGIPVLFPIAGRLPGDTYSVGDRAFTLPQHGFARGLPWTVAGTRTADTAAITVALEGTNATDVTRAVYPFAFGLRVTYALTGDTLAIDTEVLNPGSVPLPVHLGFHPYFHVPDGAKRGASVATDATRAWDNRAHALVPFTGWDLTAPETDLHLLDHRLPGTRLSAGDGSAVDIAMDPAFATLVVWSLAGRDFVCVEPWTAPAGALASGTGRVTVPTGGSWHARWTITAV